jgi:hypothetical protein
MPCPFDFFWLNDHMRSTSSILIGANAGETLGEFCGAVFVGQRERNSTQPPPQFVYDNMCKYIIFDIRASSATSSSYQAPVFHGAHREIHDGNHIQLG